ncbi:hypothetical protein MHYP_G00033280 [Metynnis hypsauchen]
MMLLFITVTLRVCTTLASKSLALEYNPYPCMHSDNASAYNSFLSKHVCSDAPKTLDQKEWQAFIKQIGTCDRPVQSFLPYSDKQSVDNVCSSSGGKTHHDNMCISKQVQLHCSARGQQLHSKTGHLREEVHHSSL